MVCAWQVATKVSSTQSWYFFGQICIPYIYATTEPFSKIKPFLRFSAERAWRRNIRYFFLFYFFTFFWTNRNTSSFPISPPILLICHFLLHFWAFQMKLHVVGIFFFWKIILKDVKFSFPIFGFHEDEIYETFFLLVISRALVNNMALLITSDSWDKWPATGITSYQQGLVIN